jgi:hypothetical protein
VLQRNDDRIWEGVDSDIPSQSGVREAATGSSLRSVVVEGNSKLVGLLSRKNQTTLQVFRSPHPVVNRRESQRGSFPAGE